MITKEQLIELGSNSLNANIFIDPINKTCIKYNINTKERLSAFLSQLYVESGCLSARVESTNYSAQGLMTTWPNRYPTLEIANKFARNPQAIANNSYNGRGGNLPNSNDGWNFRGRGLIQITFKDTYKQVGIDLGIDLINKPELLEQPEYAALSAGWFWNTRNLNILADKNTDDSFKEITKKINGGYGHLDKRIYFWNKAKNIF